MRVGTVFLVLECRGWPGEESWQQPKVSVLCGTGTAVAVFVFETGRSQSHYVTEDDLELLTFLPPTSKCEVCITMTILYSTRDQTPL